MRIYVDSHAVQRILEERFGGLQNFIEDWTAHSDGRGRDAKTVYAWLRHGLPSQRDTIFAFFGMLGVDPVAVIDLERSGLPKKFGRLRTAFMLGGGASAGGFAPLFDLYRPAVDWPNAAIARSWYGRTWTHHDMRHEATGLRNLYVTLTITSPEEDLPFLPRAYHVAYRRQASADGLWRPFGTVIDRGSERLLVHENGDIRRTEKRANDHEGLAFRTFFGPSPALFRIASLQPFFCSLQLEDNPAVPLVFEG